MTRDDIIWALEQHRGVVARAAEELLVNRTTLNSAIEREKIDVAGIRRRAQSQKRAGARESELASLREQAAAATKRAEEAERRLEELRKAKAPAARACFTKPAKGDHLRVIIPDVHGSHMDEAAVGALLGDLEQISAAHVVIMGDLLDCGGFLAAHHTMGYVAQIDESGWEDDVAAANWFLDELQKRCPSARIEYLEGNHEHRVERWIVDQVHNRRDAQALLDREGPPARLYLDRRGIEYHRRGEFLDGLEVRGVIRRGKCLFTHGEITCQNAAAATLKAYGYNVVYAHTHRPDYAMRKPAIQGSIAAWNFGCLCVKQPRYRHTRVTDWGHGYGLQLVTGSQDFTTLHVPILKGKSLLRPLLAEAGA